MQRRNHPTQLACQISECEYVFRKIGKNSHDTRRWKIRKRKSPLFSIVLQGKAPAEKELQCSTNQPA
jgi:hypothetical protein